MDIGTGISIVSGIIVVCSGAIGLVLKQLLKPNASFNKMMMLNNLAQEKINILKSQGVDITKIENVITDEIINSIAKILNFKKENLIAIKNALTAVWMATMNTSI